MARFKLTAFSKDIPLKFKFLNATILLPILFWPVIFFMSFFFFDDPNADPKGVYTLFFAVNLYPLYLIILFELNARLYKISKYTAYVLPILMIGVALLFSFRGFLFF